MSNRQSHSKATPSASSTEPKATPAKAAPKATGRWELLSSVRYTSTRTGKVCHIVAPSQRGTIYVDDLSEADAAMLRDAGVISPEVT